MKKLLFFNAMLCIACYACQKDDNHKPGLNGVFTETSPVSGRSQLEFASGNIAIKTEQGASFKDSFHYELGNGKIKLTPIWTTQYPATEFEFTAIDKTTFEIENLYPQVPGFSKTYMTYNKK